jgi:hypothetical protein
MQEDNNKMFAKTMLSMLESNTLALVYAKKHKNKDKNKLCAEKEQEIIASLNAATPDELDCFTRLFFAEFKEIYHRSHTKSDFESFENNLMLEYERIIYNHHMWNNEICFHTHDPNHYMFKDKSYNFYDEIESKGDNIFIVYDDGSDALAY